jgi:hypothetical protein
MGSATGSGAGVATVEVPDVDGMEPGSVSVVSESNDGDERYSVMDGSEDDEDSEVRGDDSAEDAGVVWVSGVRKRFACREGPGEARPRVLMGLVSGSVGSWIRRVSSCWRVLCGRGRSLP